MPSRKLDVVGELLVDLLYTVVFEEDLWDCDKKASGHHVMKTVRGSAKELCEICEEFLLRITVIVRIIENIPNS